MAITYDVINFNSSVTDGVTNSGLPTDLEMEIGIKYNSEADAVEVNKFLYNLSSALEYIQSSGSIMWIKNKKYSEGSVVNIIELNGNDYNLRKFKCISATETTNAPLQGTINTDPDTLAIFFSTPNTVNSTEWVELIEAEESVLSFNVPERTNSIRLFDIPNVNYQRINFEVFVERFNTNTADWDKLKFTVEFQSNNYNGDVSNTYLEVLDVICTNYNRTSYIPVADSSGFIPPTEYGFIFGKNRFTPLGISLSINNNSVYIDIYSDNESYIDDQKEIKFSFTTNTSSIQLVPILSQTINNINENTVVIRDGYNNSGNDCGYVVESPLRYSAEEMFKRSLLPIDTSFCMDVSAIKPGHSKIFDNKFDPNDVVSSIYDSSTKDYSKHVMPLISGTYASLDRIYKLQPWCYNTGFTFPTFFSDDSTWSMYRPYGSASGSYDCSLPSEHYGQQAEIMRKRTYCIVSHGDFSTNIFNSKNPELNVLTNEPSLYPKSKRVYKYFKY